MTMVSKRHTSYRTKWLSGCSTSVLLCVGVAVFVAIDEKTTLGIAPKLAIVVQIFQDTFGKEENKRDSELASLLCL